MSKSKESMLKRLFIVVSILALALVPFVYRSAQAANLTAMSDTMTRQQTSTASNHTVTFDQDAGTTFVAGETITIDFDDGFDTSSLANTDPLDYDIVVGPTEETVVAAGCGATDEIEITSISGTDVITFTACSGYTAEAAGVVITIEIGTHASFGGAGDTDIVNPGTTGSKVIAIGGTFGDTGNLAVPILTSDQVTVSATVDASITSSLSASTCVLGALSTTTIETCTYTNTVDTNATSGYASTILDDGNLRDGANDINDAAGDNDVDVGVEEYGASTSQAGQTIVQTVTCADPEPTPLEASALTTTAQQYASSAGPIAADVTTMCHGASITATTPAGSFSHITTHITTGTF